MACAGIVLSAFASNSAYENEIKLRRVSLGRTVDAHTLQVREKFTSRELLSRVSATLFETPNVLQAEMLAPLRPILATFKADFIVSAWIARIERSKFEDAHKALRQAGYTVSPAPPFTCNVEPVDCEASKINVLMDVEPKNSDISKHIGELADPRLDRVLARALSERSPVASEPLRRLGGTGVMVTVIVTPVTSKQTGDVAGYVTFSYDLAELIFTDTDPRFTIRIRDRENPQQELAIGDRGTVQYSPSKPVDRLSEFRREAVFGGRQFELIYAARHPIGEAAQAAAWRTLGAGLLITAIVGLALAVIGRNAIMLQREVVTRKAYAARLTSMIDELNHRVKNVLAVIQSIATRTLKDDVDVAEGRSLLIGRMHAMSHVVTLLSETEWQGVNLQDLFRPAGFANAERIEVKGPPLVISARAAQSLSLTFHELAAHLDEGMSLVGVPPKASVTWSVVNEGGRDMFKLVWRETDMRPSIRRSDTEFGVALLDRVTPEAVDGTSRRYFQDNSYIYELAAPLSAVLDMDERGRTRTISRPVG